MIFLHFNGHQDKNRPAGLLLFSYFSEVDSTDHSVVAGQGSNWIQLQGGGISFYTAPASSNAGDSITFTRRLFMRNNGNLGIGTITPNVVLDAEGDIEYTGSLMDVSDERLKENIQPIDGALGKIQAINGVSYNMIDTPKQKEIGVIAQNVQQILPEAVSMI